MASSLSRPALFLFAALALHNLEEALTYAASRPAAEALVGRELPNPAAFHVALATVTVAAALALGWAGRGEPRRAKRAIVRLIALGIVVNVAVPHVPAAILLGGYAPGVVTSVIINLPLGLWAFRRSYS